MSQLSKSNNSQSTILVEESSETRPSIQTYESNTEEKDIDLGVKKFIKKDTQNKNNKKLKRAKVNFINDSQLNQVESTESDENKFQQSMALIKYQDQQSTDLMSSTSSTSINNTIHLSIEKPFDNYKCFLCAGDMMLEFYHEDELEFTQERRIVSYRNLKRVNKAEQIQGILRIYLESNKSIVKDFQFICYLLESKQDQSLHLLSNLLKEYQIFIQNYQVYVQSILNYYKTTSMNDFNIIRELRQAYYLDYINKLMASQQQDDFCLAIQSGPSFLNLTPSYHIVEFSPALIALLGVDKDQMQHLYLRNGMRELTIYDNKQQNYIDMLSNIIEATKTSIFKSYRDYPVELFTFDNIIVKAKSNSDYFDVPLPKELEFKSTTGVYRNLDKITFIKFCVDLKEIQKLIRIRKQPKHKQIIAEQLDHFEYSIYSQIFIEKYYADHIQQNKESNI
ncbi:hypothetical protein TTHERM_00616360 (macronuclear) [Tetrahymena thermophila SB210]|uniref:Uncharacterized protein n=1 Tax=Tetrahymena thermophila (strain SB210) TaxID=312017 RepID=I7LXE2_TETTS|nr:hypothetical protein TTHERM_00616360 [Tetrahymena thermophila SB210]EAS04461.1 hypothetical protein TTHERM_00616360 [Tetrahymena thermophila SB210]|eukprot:XP_001024706.1 hypothetical protein TTHERM_00616360 [Tetrahymena thermophila SB210]